jgi:DNA-binding LytR/AlgR family response regulator
MDYMLKFRLFNKVDLRSAETSDQQAKPLFFHLWLKLGLSLIINTLNYIISYTTHQLSLTHVYYLLSDFLMIFITIEFFIVCVKALDKHLPWEQNQNKRLIVQLSLITPIVALFSAMINELSEVIIYTGRVDLSFYSFDMVVAILFILMVQFLNISLHFIQQKTASPASLESNISQIKVTQGGISKLLNQPDILGAFVISNITYVLDRNCKRYVYCYPLKELEDQLSEKFFRANRQFIISKECIEFYKSIAFGKIEIHLKCTNDITPKSIVVSRKKASQFRKWILSGLK